MAPSKEYVSLFLEKLVMEVVGTAMLCFTVATSAGQGAPLAGLAIGSTLMCIVYFGGHISGGQYNPAVALAIFLRGKMHAAEMGAYMVAQIVGGFLGGAIAMIIIPGGNIGLPAPAAGVGVGSALVGEIVQTFALCHVILHVATTAAQVNNSYYGLAIGFTVVAGAFSVGPYSGGAFNPAVGIALPALGGNGSGIWIYILGPFIGATISGLTFVATHANELPGTGPLRSLKEKFEDSAVRKMVAPMVIEFVGTGLLAFIIGTSASPSNVGLATGRSAGASPFAAIAIGGTLMCQVYAGAATSGGQFNPAVTIGIAVRKSLSTWSVDAAGAQLKKEFTNIKTGLYIVAQCLGALVGGLLARAVCRRSFTVGTGESAVTTTETQIGFPNPTGSFPSTCTDADTGITSACMVEFGIGRAFLAEIIGTFFLVFVVLQAATSSKTTNNDFFGLAIGFVVTSMAVSLGGVSGGAFNPAVGLMGIVSDYTDPFGGIWIYWVACPLGGVLAAMLFRVTNAPEFLKAEDDEKTERAVEKNNTVFADASGAVEKKANVLMPKEKGAATLPSAPPAVELTPTAGAADKV